MKGDIDRVGHCKLEWDTQIEKLLSPDGQLHLLPCDICGDPEWCDLDVVSTLCNYCVEDMDIDEDEIEVRKPPLLQHRLGQRR